MDKVVGERQLVMPGGDIRTVPVVDVSRATKRDRIDWGKEIANGHVKPVHSLGGGLDYVPSGDGMTPRVPPEVGKRYHIQGELQTVDDLERRNRPREIMREVAERGAGKGRSRFPEGFDRRTNTYEHPTGRVGYMAPRGGWPTFDEDGNIVREEE